MPSQSVDPYMLLVFKNTKSAQVFKEIKNRRIWDQQTHGVLISQQIRMRLCSF